MDYSKLEFVSKANPRGALETSYDIKIINRDTARFQITEHAFRKYGFGTQGAIQINGKDEVFIAVVENEQAVFLKNTKKGLDKSRKFKNVRLLQKLEDLKIQDDLLHLKFVETYEGMDIYKVMEGIRTSEETAAATSETIAETEVPSEDPALPESEPAPEPEAEEEDDPFEVDF